MDRSFAKPNPWRDSVVPPLGVQLDGLGTIRVTPLYKLYQLDLQNLKIFSEFGRLKLDSISRVPASGLVYGLEPLWH